MLCESSLCRRAYYLAVVNDDHHHNHNHRIHRKKKKENKKGVHSKTRGEGKDPLCDNEGEIEKETGIQRSKSEVNDVQALRLCKETFIQCVKVHSYQIKSIKLTKSNSTIVIIYISVEQRRHTKQNVHSP